MTAWILLVCAIGMVVAQIAYPGQSVYHTGWYNAIDIALLVLAALQPRKRSALAIFGCAIVVFSGVAAGLMGPDTQTVIGAPGAATRNADVGGQFVFPLAKSGAPVMLERGGGSVAIGSTPRYSGGFMMWQTPRTVVYVDASDAAGNHLTITQPTNASFLSPVLLMQQSTNISGMDVQYDTFSVPAKRRNVKAVLFSQEQAAQLHGAAGKPAVLFAVSDNNDRVLPGGISMVPSGDRKRIAGLVLGADVESYPAIVVAAAPYLPVFALGVLVFLAGLYLQTRRSATSA